MDDYLITSIALKTFNKRGHQYLPVLVPETAAAHRDAAGAGHRSSPPVDAALITATWGGGEKMVETILAEFRRVNDEDAASLLRAVAGKDLAHVTLSSHRMLGASRMIGAHPFSQVCEAIDRASRARDWSGILASMEAFQKEWARLNTYFDGM